MARWFGCCAVVGLLVELLLTTAFSAPKSSPAAAPAYATPWPPQYKIKPEDKQRLTAADVVGPDGIVYPDWSKAGIAGGIPQVPVAAKASAFGGKANDNQDDSRAILAAVESLGEGGGAVLLEPGIYYLDRPIGIRKNGVVIRGAGRERTRIVFRYALGEKGVRWAEPMDGEDLYTDTPLTFQAKPENLVKLEIFAGDVSIAKKEYHKHWGNTFSVTAGGWSATKAAPQDAKNITLRGVATYKDGATRELTKTLRVMRTSGDPENKRRVSAEVAIGFGGEARPKGSKPIKLAEDGKRGAKELVLEDASALKAGDRLVIEGPVSERWRALTRNVCQHGAYRRNMLEIAAVEGNKVSITDALRIEFPVSDGSFVYKTQPIQRCGIEDLTIEQTENLWITTVQFANAWECWARGVTVKKCGRFPVYGNSAKHCVIQDCIFDDAWFKGGGGTAYAGWEFSYDCLMTDCTTFKLRHAPCVQWSASGNVIRKSTFNDSDAQWHSGWTNENLFEQCTVLSKRGNGSYGNAAWASPPDDEAHGPNGPRNVVYNCDIQGEKSGIWLGGMNENWILAYNRVISGTESIFVKTTSFDHIIRGNVFAMTTNKSPAIVFSTDDCNGMEVYDNQVYGGSGALIGGKSRPLMERNNTVGRLRGTPPMPRVAVPSIYEWQLKNAAKRTARD